MGHFSQTCLISHLPITGGTPIRVCLLSSSPYGGGRDRHGEAWSFRSIPFRAEYNDYGSIENVHPEDEVLVDLAIAQFNRDAIEIPQGDNPYHDPPVTRGMPAEGWWDALWEGRLRVRETYGRSLKVKVPKGLPTWRRVAKLTNRAVAQGKLIPGSTPNRIAYGLVRVTYHGKWDDRGVWYAAIRPILERHYKVTERYEHGPKYHQELMEKCPDKDWAVYGDVWFEVSPKDGPYPPVSPARERREQTLLHAIENSNGVIRGVRRTCDIGWAFIREDVWQAVLPLGGPNYTGWGDSPTVESEKAKLTDSIARAAESAKMWEEIKAIPKGEGRASALLDILDGIDLAHLGGVKPCLEDKYPALNSSPPFMEGMAGQVSDLMNRLSTGTATREQGDRVVQAVAEYAVVRSIMSTVCIAPHPTHGGPQDGAWEAHVAFHNALTPVVLGADPYPPEEGSESDGGGAAPESGDTGVETPYANVDIEHD